MALGIISLLSLKKKWYRICHLFESKLTCKSFCPNVLGFFWECRIWAPHLHYSHATPSSNFSHTPSLPNSQPPLYYYYIHIHVMCVYSDIYTRVYEIYWVHLALLILTDVRLTSWDWTIYVGACPWRKLILLLLAALTTCSPSSRGRTLWSFPCSRWHVRVSCSWEYMAHSPCHV